VWSSPPGSAPVGPLVLVELAVLNFSFPVDAVRSRHALVRMLAFVCGRGVPSRTLPVFTREMCGPGLARPEEAGGIRLRTASTLTPAVRNHHRVRISRGAVTIVAASVKV
jgi:hypothetical protein